MPDVGTRTTPVSSPLRWSSVRDCTRKAAYEAAGAPHRERTNREERILARGRAVGHEYLVAIANESRRTIHVCSGVDFMLPYPNLRATSEDAAGILAELPVQWELGIGHADGYIRDSDVVLEVLSSQNASGDLIHSKLLQAAGYARALDAAAVCVAIVDPATLDDDRVIVTRYADRAKTKVADRWVELMDEIDARIAALLEWRGGGKLPDRVCRKPTESWGHFCLYAGQCFDDPPAYEADFAAELQSDEAQLLAIELAQLKTQRRELSAADKGLEQRQKELQEQLARFVPHGDWQVGGYAVGRSERTRRSFDLTRAALDSRFPDVLLDEFTKTSTYDVWTVAKTGDVTVTADEEVPF